MSRHINPNLIPTVGAPGIVLSWWPTALVQCHCDLDQPNTLVVPMFGVEISCAKCGGKWVIVRVKEDNTLDVRYKPLPPELRPKEVVQ